MPNVAEKVWNNSLQTCEYIDGYINASSILTVKCIKHNHIFTTKYENIRRDGRAHLICPYCQEESRKERYSNNRTKVQCSYCGIEFFKSNSKLDNSKSGLYFCCREHKDLAQRIESGLEFNIIRPEHYNEIISDYRKLAFRNYSHSCKVCGWNEDEDVLEVHHIDENRKNNALENLIILCPICHKKLTTHKYNLIDNKIIKI